MAIGYPPKHHKMVPLGDLSYEAFLVLAMEAAASMQWQLQYLSSAGFIAVTTNRQEQINVRIKDESVSLESGTIKSTFFDNGKNRQNITAFTSKIATLKNVLSNEYLASRYEALVPFFPPPEVDLLQHTPRRERSHAADLLAIFRPVKDYFITPIILNLNLAVFLLMAISGVSMVEPDSKSLLDWGANLRPLVSQGEWWRLITSCFLHIGVIHLLMNMYAFLLIGAQLEPRLGKMRFVSAYIVTGITASLASIWWHNHTISAGASGAIFGMYGVFLAMLTTDLVEKGNRKQLLASILFFVVYSLLGGLKEGVDNAAHLGGLIMGLILGYCYVPGLRQNVALSKEVEQATEAAAQVGGDYGY